MVGCGGRVRIRGPVRCCIFRPDDASLYIPVLCGVGPEYARVSLPGIRGVRADDGGGALPARAVRFPVLPQTSGGRRGGADEDPLRRGGLLRPGRVPSGDKELRMAERGRGGRSVRPDHGACLCAHVRPFRRRFRPSRASPGGVSGAGSGSRRRILGRLHGRDRRLHLRDPARIGPVRRADPSVPVRRRAPSGGSLRDPLLSLRGREG